MNVSGAQHPGRIWPQGCLETGSAPGISFDTAKLPVALDLVIALKTEASYHSTITDKLKRSTLCPGSLQSSYRTLNKWGRHSLLSTFSIAKKNAGMPEAFCKISHSSISCPLLTTVTKLNMEAEKLANSSRAFETNSLNHSSKE